MLLDTCVIRTFETTLPPGANWKLRSIFKLMLTRWRRPLNVILKTFLILIKAKESIGIFKNVCSKKSKVVFTSIQFDCFSCWKFKINAMDYLISLYWFYADLNHEVPTISCITKFGLISAWPIISSFLWNSFCEQLPVICNLMSWVKCPRFHQRRIQINLPGMITHILVSNDLPTLPVIIAETISLIKVVWVIWKKLNKWVLLRDALSWCRNWVNRAGPIR